MNEPDWQGMPSHKSDRWIFGESSGRFCVKTMFMRPAISAFRAFIVGVRAVIGAVIAWRVIGCLISAVQGNLASLIQ